MEDEATKLAASHMFLGDAAVEATQAARTWNAAMIGVNAQQRIIDALREKSLRPPTDAEKYGAQEGFGLF